MRSSHPQRRTLRACAVAATQALETVVFDDPAAIRDALVGMHDAHEALLATVTIYDPVTGTRHGRGLRFEDIF